MCQTWSKQLENEDVLALYRGVFLFFSPASHDIAEILLNLYLNTNQSINHQREPLSLTS